MDIASELLSANFSYTQFLVTKTHLNERTFLKTIRVQLACDTKPGSNYKKLFFVTVVGVMSSEWNRHTGRYQYWGLVKCLSSCAVVTPV